VTLKNQETENFNLQKVIMVLTKSYRLIFGSVIIWGMIAGIISFTVRPTYEAETTIRIQKPKGLNESLLAGAASVNPLEIQQLMSTYSEILKGRTVLENTIGKVFQGKRELIDYKKLAKRIDTLQIKDTELLKITVRSNSAHEAAVFANTLIDVFMDRLIELSRTKQRTVRDFLAERLKHSKLELQRAEKNLENYKKNREIVAPQEETKALVERMSQLNQLVAENRINLATFQAKLNNIHLQLGKEKEEFIADSSVIQNYKTKLAELEIKLVGLAQQYTENHPDVISTKAEIETTKTKLNTEIDRIISAQSPSGNPVHLELFRNKLTTEIELAAAQAQKLEIDQIQARSEREILTLPDKERMLARLMREANLSQDIFLMLAKRHEEAQISEVMQLTDVQVVEKAKIPALPAYPKKTRNIILAAALGLFVGIGLAFGWDSFHKTINSVQDVQNYMGLPVLGSIQDFKNIKPKTGPRDRSNPIN
jgi:uncharacterized protein involved in exopolysaccharide biosynthesis